MIFKSFENYLENVLFLSTTVRGSLEQWGRVKTEGHTTAGGWRNPRRAVYTTLGMETVRSLVALAKLPACFIIKDEAVADAELA